MLKKDLEKRNQELVNKTLSQCAKLVEKDYEIKELEQKIQKAKAQLNLIAAGLVAIALITIFLVLPAVL